MSVNLSLVSTKIIMLFLVLICGVYARRRKFIGEKSTTALSRLLLNVTQPLMIISTFQLKYDKTLIKNGIFVLISAVVVHIAVTFIVIPLFSKEKDLKQNVIFRYGAIFANCAFLGFPVLEVIFGGSGVGIFYGSFYCIMFNVYNWTYGYSMMQSSEYTKISYKKAFINVGTVSTAIGIVLFLTQLKLPIAISGAMAFVGDMTFPLSMIIIGSLVATLNLKKALLNIKVYYFCFIKLIVLPLIAIVVCHIFSINNTVAYMTIIMCAMPSATNTAIFADVFGQDKLLAAECVGVSTLLSVGTIPLIIMIANAIL